MPIPPRLTLAIVVAGLLLGGCAHQPPARERTTVTATPSPAAASSSHRAHVSTSPTEARDDHEMANDAGLPDQTGIAACDDYLSSYIACHRAAAIYAPDQLQSRYEAMRTSLLRDSQNPEIRPQLGARCNSLASQLRQALHGKSCANEPAEAGSSP
jgi:hypothetical protein